jgi:hypothetical protein
LFLPSVLLVFASAASCGTEPTQPGLIGYSLGSSTKCGTVRTRAIWKDQAAMMDFVVTPEHSQAALQVGQLATSFKVTSFSIPLAEVPLSWENARAALATVANVVVE